MGKGENEKSTLTCRVTDSGLGMACMKRGFTCLFEFCWNIVDQSVVLVSGVQQSGSVNVVV